MFRRRPTMTVADATATYLADLAIAGRAEGTVALYRYLLDRLMKRIGKEHNLATLRRDEITQFLGEIKTNGGSQGYTNLAGHVVKGFLAWSTRQDYIKCNPMEGMILPKEHPEPPRPFTDDEIRRFMAAATTPLVYAVVMILLDTGLRASEFCGLRMGDVDFENGTLRVLGKGSKRRVVALNEGPRQALLAYLQSRAQLDGTIWPEHFDRKHLAYLLDCLGRRAGVPRIHPHLFRHTFACRFLALTNNPLALQALLGHATLDMTRHYVSLVQGELAVEVHRQHPLT